MHRHSTARSGVPAATSSKSATPRPPSAQSRPFNASAGARGSARAGRGGASYRGRNSSKRGAENAQAVVVLPLEIAYAIANRELQARHSITDEWWGGVTDLHACLTAMGRRRLDQEALSGMVRGCVQSWSFTELDEVAERAKIGEAMHASMTKIKRRAAERYSPNAWAELAQLEDARRSKLAYLEKQTFQDVLRLEKETREGQRRHPGQRSRSTGGVKLYSGCPFLHPHQCPFNCADWVDEESLMDQHYHRKHPQLSRPQGKPNAEDMRYTAMLERRQQRMQNLSVKMFQARVHNGVST